MGMNVLRALLEAKRKQPFVHADLKQILEAAEEQ